MRRRLQRFLPIVLAALAIQMTAQIGACWADALAVADPFSSFPICHGGGDLASGGSHQGSDTDHDCASCCVLSASLSFDAPRPTTLAMPLRHQVEAVLRGYDRPCLLGGRTGSNSLARGPPQTI